MQLTTRESISLLRRRTGLSPEQIRQLLVAGFAGPGELVGRSTLYDHAQVKALGARATVDSDRLMRVCPHGLYVARLSRATAFSLAMPWSAQARLVAVQPPLPALTRASVNVRIAAWEPLPWVATISGFVAFGAEAEAAFTDRDGRAVFTLREPGAWFDAVAGRCLPTGRGRPWALRLPPLQE
jgi:hypothetical protein